MLLVSMLGVWSCGGRSELHQGSGEPLQPCETTVDCVDGDRCRERVCAGGWCETVHKTECSDGDACTADRCEPTTGTCEFKPVAPDADHDSFSAIVSVTQDAKTTSCGNDCDDASALAHPGGTELCDGVDNDCNGIIDDGNQTYTSSSDVLALTSPADGTPQAGDIAFDGERFGITLATSTGHWQSQFLAISPSGQLQVPATAMTRTVADSMAGPLLFEAGVYASAWEDRRGNSFDIFFNRFDRDGSKLAPDLQVTSERGFSIQPDLAWTGEEYLLVWADDAGSNRYRVYGVRISRDGALLGNRVELTGPSEDARAPRLALGKTGAGLVYALAGGDGLGFLQLSRSLEPKGKAQLLPTRRAPIHPTLSYLNGRYLVVYGEHEQGWGPGVYGLVLDEQAQLLRSETLLSSGQSLSRGHAAVSLGDRLLLVSSDDASTPGTLQLRSLVLSSELEPLAPAVALTNYQGDLFEPGLSHGRGKLGVIFQFMGADQRGVGYVGLDCERSLAGGTPPR